MEVWRRAVGVAIWRYGGLEARQVYKYGGMEACCKCVDILEVSRSGRLETRSRAGDVEVLIEVERG